MRECEPGESSFFHRWLISKTNWLLLFYSLVMSLWLTLPKEEVGGGAKGKGDVWQENVHTLFSSKSAWEIDLSNRRLCHGSRRVPERKMTCSVACVWKYMWNETSTLLGDTHNYIEAHNHTQVRVHTRKHTHTSYFLTCISCTGLSVSGYIVLIWSPVRVCVVWIREIL